jgi:hypothetical protein
VRRTATVLLLLAATAAADRAVGRDGKIWTGTVAVTKDVAAVGRKKIPLNRLYLVEREDGTLVYAPDFAARLRGYEYLAHEHVRDAYVKLVRECNQVGDFTLARELLELAERAGLSSREATKLKLRIEAAEKKKRDSVTSKRLRREASVHSAYFGELLAERAARALDGGRDGPRLLREALRRAPDSKHAAALLEKIAKKDFPIGTARTWLDWHLDVEATGARIGTGEEKPLQKARAQWRRDLHGVHARPILLVTPVQDAFMVGRCLAHGRLACSALAQLFATEKPVRKTAHALTVFLFESKKEYVTTSGTGRKVENPAFLEWTAGHYSPGEGVSRFYWHTDPDAERRIVGTCVHELTHHWLNEYNPRATGLHGAGMPAFWIVEGFATFMEEGIYDVESGEWDLFNPRSRSLDVMQAIKAKYLIPWDALYGMSQVGFHSLPGEVVSKPVPLRWNLSPTVLTGTRLFYEQAGATCQFLYHGDNGKHRGKLIDFACSYYSGRVPELDPKKAFGLEAKELGRLTVEFARAVANGWRPQ